MSKVLSEMIILPEDSKVGLFGGSFNPAHEWHYQVANEAYKSLGLDLVIWLVSPHNPLKEVVCILANLQTQIITLLIYFPSLPPAL